MEFDSIFRTEKTGSFDFRKGPFHDCPITHAAVKNNLLSSRRHIFSCRSIAVLHLPKYFVVSPLDFTGAV